MVTPFANWVGPSPSHVHNLPEPKEWLDGGSFMADGKWQFPRNFEGGISGNYPLNKTLGRYLSIYHEGWALRRSNRVLEKMKNTSSEYFNLSSLYMFSFATGSLVAQMVKHLPTMWETQVWSLGWEEPLEKEMATYSSTLAWIIPWIEGGCRPKSTGLQRVRHDWATSLHFCY